MKYIDLFATLLNSPTESDLPVTKVERTIFVAECSMDELMNLLDTNGFIIWGEEFGEDYTEHDTFEDWDYTPEEKKKMKRAVRFLKKNILKDKAKHGNNYSHHGMGWKRADKEYRGGDKTHFKYHKAMELEVKSLF